MDALSGAGTGWTRDNSATYAATDDVGSYVVSASAKPIEGLTLGLAYDCELGDEDRNETFNAFAEFSIACFTFDGEYFAAIDREKHYTDNKAYEEKAWVIGVAYQVMEPLEIAIRYEDFDIDHDTATDGDFDYTLAVGANYQILENVTLMAEYRKLEQEDANDGSYYETGVNEFNFRVAVGF